MHSTVADLVPLAPNASVAEERLVRELLAKEMLAREVLAREKAAKEMLQALVVRLTKVAFALVIALTIL